MHVVQMNVFTHIENQFTWRSMEGGAIGSLTTWLRVFLPFKVVTDGLLAVVMSQKLLFFAGGTGDLNRWTGLLISPVYVSLGRKLLLVTILLPSAF